MTKKLAVVACLFLTAAAEAATEKKPTMAVFDFTNSTRAAWWYSGVGSDLADMLTNELASTEKFKMVERKQLGAILSEQDLALAGAVKPATAAKAGKMTGAQYLVTGQVSAYEEDVKGTGGGIGFKGIGVGGKKEEAYIAVDLRVVNTTSGEIAFTRTVEARAGSKALSVGINKGGVSAGFGKMEKTPAGKAIRACLIEISDYLTCAMVDKGDCLAEYQAKEKARREKTKGKIKLD
jgi:curli biogenesis system outer membrane secretion channel CsgG